MTAPPHGPSASSRRRPHAELGAESDDALIDGLRARAWDPGLRFDTAAVPAAWIEEHFGGEHLLRIRDRIRFRGGDGTIGLRAHDEEVAAYFADAPRAPLIPPVTPREVDAAESAIGRPLPELLRRIYTEVGDGGFGPDLGLASLTEGRRPPGHLEDWPCAVTAYVHNRAVVLPPSWLYLTSGGCTMEWHVSLLAVGNPVLLYDTDGWDRWEPDLEDSPHDGLRYAAASLRQWLWTWANGGEVWAGALAIE